jgi:hypothetical protein
MLKEELVNIHCEELQKLFDEVPIFGSGQTALDIQRVYLKALTKIASLRTIEPFKPIDKPMGVIMLEVRKAVDNAVNAKSDESRKVYFIRAAQQLGEAINSAMEMIRCL